MTAANVPRSLPGRSSPNIRKPARISWATVAGLAGGSDGQPNSDASASTLSILPASATASSSPMARPDSWAPARPLTPRTDRPCTTISVAPPLCGAAASIRWARAASTCPPRLKMATMALIVHAYSSAAGAVCARRKTEGPRPTRAGASGGYPRGETGRCLRRSVRAGRLSPHGVRLIAAPVFVPPPRIVERIPVDGSKVNDGRMLVSHVPPLTESVGVWLLVVYLSFDQFSLSNSPHDPWKPLESVGSESRGPERPPPGRKGGKLACGDPF